VCVQCTVQSETVISMCTVQSVLYTHKYDWINMQPYDQTDSFLTKYSFLPNHKVVQI